MSSVSINEHLQRLLTTMTVADPHCFETPSTISLVEPAKFDTGLDGKVFT
jgi:hypothetical protein